MREQAKRLQYLQEQRMRKQHLESLRSELTGQLRELSDKTINLRAAMNSEQQDVERLNGRGLVALFYELIGKKEQKLKKEQQEAYAARVKYETAVQEQEAVESRLRRTKEELVQIETCEAEYERLLNALLGEIRASGDSRSEELLRIEQEITGHKAVIRELAEAIAAGGEVLSAVGEVMRHLEDAENWSTWDLFGGGLLADIAKHDALESAQRAVEQLQINLRSFKTELVDVNVEANVQIRVEGMLEFADFFFDGFLVDYAVMEHIEKTIGEVKATKNKVEGVLQTLRDLQKQREAAVRQAEHKLADLAMQE